MIRESIRKTALVLVCLSSFAPAVRPSIHRTAPYQHSPRLPAASSQSLFPSSSRPFVASSAPVRPGFSNEGPVQNLARKYGRTHLLSLNIRI